MGHGSTSKNVTGLDGLGGACGKGKMSRRIKHWPTVRNKSELRLSCSNDDNQTPKIDAFPAFHRITHA